MLVQEISTKTYLPYLHYLTGLVINRSVIPSYSKQVISVFPQLNCYLTVCLCEYMSECVSQGVGQQRGASVGWSALELD